MHLIKYSGFSLIMVVMVYKIAANIQLVNTEPLFLVEIYLNTDYSYKSQEKPHLILIDSTFLTQRKWDSEVLNDLPEAVPLTGAKEGCQTLSTWPQSWSSIHLCTAPVVSMFWSRAYENCNKKTQRYLVWPQPGSCGTSDWNFLPLCTCL